MANTLESREWVEYEETAQPRVVPKWSIGKESKMCN